MKPECESVQDKLLADVDASREDAVVRAHLESCADCRAFLEDYRQIGAGFDALEAAVGPSELTTARILLAAKRKQSERAAAPAAANRPWYFSRGLQVAAMFAVIAGVGIYSQKWLENQHHELNFPASKPAPIQVPADGAGGGLMAPESDKPLTPPEAPALGEKSLSAPAKAKAKESAKRSSPLEIAPAPAVAPQPSTPDFFQPATEKEAEQPATNERRMKDLEQQQAEPKPVAPAIQGGLGVTAPSGNAAPANTVAPDDLSRSRGQAGKANAVPAKPQINLEPDLDAASPGAPAQTKTPAAPPPAPRLQNKQKAVDQAEAGEDKTRKSDEETFKSKKADDGAYQSLLRSAKAKIQAKNWPGAMDDLLQAQQIKDSSEIQGLIVMVRTHLRGDE